MQYSTLKRVTYLGSPSELFVMQALYAYFFLK